MRILADENIPYVHEFFDRFGEVTTAHGRTMSPADLDGIDILLVRSVTPVNAALLAESHVKFVGTCTIGTDHLDTHFLDERGIRYASAPGCNAAGVLQYDLAALSEMDPTWMNKRVGVIGHGNVGGLLARSLNALEVNVCAYDPMRDPKNIPYLTSLQNVLSCDVICMHTPYTVAGQYPTHHMIGRAELERIGSDAILLNAGRGGAIDNKALTDVLSGAVSLKVVLDVWEHEPSIATDLIDLVDIATPHIAGYSFEGKLMGTAMIYKQLVSFLGLDRDQYKVACNELLIDIKGPPSEIHVDSIQDAFQQTYSVVQDDQRTRRALCEQNSDEVGKRFDQLRKTYPERRDFSHFRISCSSRTLAAKLEKVGFQTR